MNNGKQSARGFTLIELLITVAIVALLASLAYPAYLDQVRKSRRAEAQSGLQDLALQQERWRNNDTDYATLDELDAPTSDHYTFAVTANTATGFTMTATAGTAQSKDTEGGVSCTPLSVDNNNNRLPAGCW